jgi:hypothetical protein
MLPCISKKAASIREKLLLIKVPVCVREQSKNISAETDYGLKNTVNKQRTFLRN